MPDQRFRGVVSKVAPLPDSQSRWGNPDLKVYATEILITDKLPDVKPGVSARAEIIITNLANALTRADPGRDHPQRQAGGLSRQRAARAGAGRRSGCTTPSSSRSASGLKEGDRVLLAPPFDTQEKDLGGAIIADGETLPAGDTNQSARSAARATRRNARRRPSKAVAKDPWPRDAITNAAARGGSVGGDADSRGSSAARRDLRTAKRGRQGRSSAASPTNRAGAC